MNDFTELDQKLLKAILNPLFPVLDSKLRSGLHISPDNLELHAFLVDYQTELEQFYLRYNVELILAPEQFFYLRSKNNALLNRSTLNELEMLLGKVLCYLYLSPEKLARHGIFTYQDIFEELLMLTDQQKLHKLVNPKSTGSDLDKDRLFEKVATALRRLTRIGFINRIGDQNSKKFTISEAVFRFAGDVRTNEDPLSAQLRLIKSGDAVSAKLQEEDLDEHQS